MNRNVESHFSELPSVDIQRSIFDRSSTHKTSFNVGDVIPFYIDEVLPGDSFRVSTSKVVRLQTMLTPIMDNIYLDTYYFFVPNRLVWTHWKEFMGENNSSPWVQTTQYQVPRISSPSGGFAVGTIADYLGLPTGVQWSATAVNAPSALPFRVYAKCMSDWFTNENVTDPLNIPTGDSNQTGTNGGSYINDVANGGLPFKAAKYFDAFTSCLPSPQKATNPVKFPLIGSQVAPVKPYSGNVFQVGTAYSSDPMTRLRFFGVSSANVVENLDSGLHNAAFDGNYLIQTNSTSTGSAEDYVVPANLFADLSNSVGAVTINELRLAFQLQKFYERCARGGTRYIELLKSHFGVTSPDARLQRSEYLGGNRIPLQIHEVTNSAQSTNDFLGDLGAKSATSDIHEDFEKSFTEHGFVIGVCVARYDHSYPQGIEKFWLRKNTTDYKNPQKSDCSPRL